MRDTGGGETSKTLGRGVNVAAIARHSEGPISGILTPSPDRPGQAEGGERGGRLMKAGKKDARPAGPAAACSSATRSMCRWTSPRCGRSDLNLRFRRSDRNAVIGSPNRC